MEEILDIFNDKLEIIGQDTRKNVHRKGVLHQVVHCWAIEDAKDGRFVYMQQRAEFKDFPLLFDITVGGHIDSGENIENAMIREIKEEIGLDLKIEEHASNLSGGQKQRLAIARALVRKCPLLVLDESTSGLDTQTETTVLANIRRAYPNLTLLLVTHRIDAAEQTDPVVVMGHGKVLCSGNPCTLSQEDNAWSRLISAQIGA